MIAGAGAPGSFLSSPGAKAGGSATASASGVLMLSDLNVQQNLDLLETSPHFPREGLGLSLVLFDGRCQSRFEMKCTRKKTRQAFVLSKFGTIVVGGQEV